MRTKLQAHLVFLYVKTNVELEVGRAHTSEILTLSCALRVGVAKAQCLY